VNDEEVFVSETAITSATSVLVPITLSGYYRLQVTGSVATTLTVSTVVGPATGLTPDTSAQTACTNVWQHRQAPPVGDILSKLTGVSVQGGAIRYSNNGAPLYLNGTVQAASYAGSEDWQLLLVSNACDATFYNKLGASSGFEQFKAAKGFYTFLKVQQSSDLAFATDIQTNGTNTITVGQFPLLGSSPFVAFCATVQTSTTLSAPESTMILGANLEFTTSNKGQGQKISNTDPREWEASLWALSSMKQFYENPAHWSDILKTINSIFGLSAPILTALGGALAASGNAYAVPAGFLVSALGVGAGYANKRLRAAGY